MRFTRVAARQSPDPKPGSRAPSTSTASAIPTSSHASAAPTSGSPPAPGRHGTPTPGQTLYVTDGIGYVGRRSGGVQEIRPGDVVYIEPSEEHWHGATPDRFMAHVAIQEADENGQVVTWGDHVTDQEYGSR